MPGGGGPRWPMPGGGPIPGGGGGIPGGCMPGGGGPEERNGNMTYPYDILIGNHPTLECMIIFTAIELTLKQSKMGGWLLTLVLWTKVASALKGLV